MTTNKQSLTKLIDKDDTAALGMEFDTLLSSLGQGKIRGAAYDTAWAARLEKHYPGRFMDSLEWLRRNQFEDGTWGADVLHYHDRFASTLAAVVALKEVGKDSRDERRVQRGVAALWRLVSKLSRDDSDTVGFPVVAAVLGRDAAALGLDIPRPTIRYGDAYRRKVEKMLGRSQRDWRTSALSFSLEGLWHDIAESDIVLEANGSVASSPAATAAYLFTRNDEAALKYLLSIKEADGSMPALAPVDVFDITWSLSQLQDIDLVNPQDPQIRRALDHLWQRWSPETGLYYSSYFRVPDLDITSASFALLRWGGYPVQADVFEYFEMDDHFCTYRDESHPSSAAHLRLLLALQACPEHPKQPAWMEKALGALRRYDANGTFWWDKWHASPYYVTNLAMRAFARVDRELAASRLKWVERTQNDDGGWGYFDQSTVEETAYCLDTLLLWRRLGESVDPGILEAGANFLRSWGNKEAYTPLWISKGLYTPYNIVKSILLSARYHLMEMGI